MNARRVMRVQPPSPLGDMTVAPAALTGRAEADMAHAMAAALAEYEVPSAAEVLGRLRRAFPAGAARCAPDGARPDDGAQPPSDWAVLAS